MTDLQYEKKILELNQYIEKINDVVWTEICSLDDPFRKEAVIEIVNVLNEWTVNN
jgi:hypothetical protein